MRVLVTGVKGQLGHDVMDELAAKGIEGIGVDVEEMDITDCLLYTSLGSYSSFLKVAHQRLCSVLLLLVLEAQLNSFITVLFYSFHLSNKMCIRDSGIIHGMHAFAWGYPALHFHSQPKQHDRLRW